MKLAISILVVVAALVGVWYLWNSASSPVSESDMDADEASESEDNETAGSDDGTITEDSADMAGDETDNAVTIEVTGRNHEFDMKEIRVDEGDTVTINFSSADGFHDFVIDEFDAATERVNTGETSSVTFVAEKAGTYEYYCSVGNHRAMGMVGTLIVE